MEKREGFVFYRSFFEAIMMLPAESREAVFEAICRYGLDRDESGNDGTTAAMMSLIKPQIDANQKRYQNGKTGGRPKKVTEGEPTDNLEETKQKPNRNQAETKAKPNQNQTETKEGKSETKAEPKEKDKVKVKDKEKETYKEKETPEGFISALNEPPEMKERLSQFLKMRNRIKKPITAYGMKLAYQNLLKLGRTQEERYAILDQSTMNCWQGLYPLKEQAKHNKFHHSNERPVNEAELERLLGID